MVSERAEGVKPTDLCECAHPAASKVATIKGLLCVSVVEDN